MSVVVNVVSLPILISLSVSFRTVNYRINPTNAHPKILRRNSRLLGYFTMAFLEQGWGGVGSSSSFGPDINHIIITNTTPTVL